MVATDSYRLAVSETELDSPCPEEFEAVIAGSFLQDIASLPQSEDPITIALNDNQIVVTYRDTTFINRRIENLPELQTAYCRGSLHPRNAFDSCAY